MRIDLRVPYAEKDEAKMHGAKWDAARKVWFLRDVEDLTPFMRWMPDRLVSPHVPRPSKAHKPRKDRSRPVTTEMRSDGSIPDCGCQDVAPWEECIHNEQPLDDESAARLSHLLGS